MTACGEATTRASDAVPAAAVGVSETPKAPRVLVMNNGDLVEGEIAVSQSGYELTQSGGGRILLAKPFVWFTADSRHAAYHELRKCYPDQSAGGHVALSRWCTRYGLKDAAEEELQIALTMDPQHREARNLLKLTAEPAKPIPSFVENASDGYDPNGALGGLHPELAVEFVSKVQPILVNGCGNASCHGTASKNAFTIQNVRSGNPAFRALTQRNLDTVRRRIDAKDPLHSSILTEPQQAGHGGSHRAIFAGPSGAAHLKLLQAWIVAVGRSAPATRSNETKEPSPIALTSGTQSSPRTSSDGSDSEPKPVPPSSVSPASDPVTDVLRQAIKVERADAFDPHEFNRRFGPDAERPSLPASEGPQP
jgi:hypothetical protein